MLFPWMFAGTISLAISFSCIYLVRTTFHPQPKEKECFNISHNPYLFLPIWTTTFFLEGGNHKIAKMCWHLIVPLFLINRKTCWGRGRKLCFVAILYSYRCRCKHCFMANFTKKCCFSWSFWCCFWVVYHKCPCKGNYLKYVDLSLSSGF